MQQKDENNSSLGSVVPDSHSVILTVTDLSIAMAGRTILKNASFRLMRNASLAVIGPNGSGKTLVLKALLGIQSYKGAIQWTPGTQLGYVPQNISADPQFPLQVRELLRAKAGLRHHTREEIESAVAWAGISDLLDRRLGALSSGQLQRVLIGFALIGSPDALLVDEPTSSLDELAEEHFFELLKRARSERGTTVVMVSHDLTLVRGIATHVLCVSGGTVWFGAAREMLRPEILERVYGQPVEFHSHHLERNP